LSEGQGGVGQVPGRVRRNQLSRARELRSRTEIDRNRNRPENGRWAPVIREEVTTGTCDCARKQRTRWGKDETIEGCVPGRCSGHAWHHHESQLESVSATTTRNSILGGGANFKVQSKRCGSGRGDRQFVSRQDCLRAEDRTSPAQLVSFSSPVTSSSFRIDLIAGSRAAMRSISLLVAASFTTPRRTTVSPSVRISTP